MGEEVDGSPPKMDENIVTPTGTVRSSTSGSGHRIKGTSKSRVTDLKNRKLWWDRKTC